MEFGTYVRTQTCINERVKVPYYYTEDSILCYSMTNRTGTVMPFYKLCLRSYGICVLIRTLP